ncbi:RsiV family protein [Nocardia sp. NPDC056100]|uniref:RsiV family protein n=1 Tax=Nocardia sp. NPDC056100 TaxID=3345712 RepID=UPI0035E2B6FF
MRGRTATIVAIAALTASLAACRDDTTTAHPTTGPVGSSVSTGQPADSIPPRATTVLTPAQAQVTGYRGSMTFDVTLPQVSGGTGPAATEFNTGMHALLQARIDQYFSAAKSLTDPNKLSKLDHIGDHVVSGLLWISVDGGGAHPWTELATHVTDIDTGKALELQDLFTDEQAGLRVLSTQAETLGPQSRAGTYFDAKGVTPTRDHFKTWTATPAGMHVYFQMGQAGPAALGPFDITIPWSALGSVLAPGLSGVLSS